MNTLINFFFSLEGMQFLISPANVSFSEGLNSFDVVGIAVGCYLLVGVGVQMQTVREGTDFGLSIDIYRCVKLFD